MALLKNSVLFNDLEMRIRRILFSGIIAQRSKVSIGSFFRSSAWYKSYIKIFHDVLSYGDIARKKICGDCMSSSQPSKPDRQTYI